MDESEDIFADNETPVLEEDKEDEEEEELTAAEVVERMERAWTNEKFSPELLPPQTEVIECLLDQVSRTESSSTNKDFTTAIHKMEMARIKFLISSYLRLRLEKIQKYAMTLNGGSSSSLMTDEEAAFCQNYKDNVTSHYETLALKHMPGDFGTLDPKKMDFPEPDLNRSVFIRVLEDCPGVILDDETGLERDEEVDLIKGSQHILKYKAVRELVQNGSVQLI